MWSNDAFSVYLVLLVQCCLMLILCFAGYWAVLHLTKPTSMGGDVLSDEQFSKSTSIRRSPSSSSLPFIRFVFCEHPFLGLFCNRYCKSSSFDAYHKLPKASEKQPLTTSTGKSFSESQTNEDYLFVLSPGVLQLARIYLALTYIAVSLTLITLPFLGINMDFTGDDPISLVLQILCGSLWSLLCAWIFRQFIIKSHFSLDLCLPHSSSNLRNMHMRGDHSRNASLDENLDAMCSPVSGKQSSSDIEEDDYDFDEQMESTFKRNVIVWIDDQEREIKIRRRSYFALFIWTVVLIGCFSASFTYLITEQNHILWANFSKSGISIALDWLGFDLLLLYVDYRFWQVGIAIRITPWQRRHHENDGHHEQFPSNIRISVPPQSSPTPVPTPPTITINTMSTATTITSSSNNNNNNNNNNNMNLLNILDETRRIWQRDVFSLPIASDLPRFARKLEVHINGRVVYPSGSYSADQLETSVLIENFLSCLITEIEGVDRATNILEFFKATGEHPLPSRLAKLLQECSQDIPKTCNILKMCTQSIVAPAYMRIRVALEKSAPFKDVPNGWKILISFEKDSVRVMHTKIQQNRSDEPQFTFEWRLLLELDVNMNNLCHVSFGILNEHSTFSELLSSEKREEIRRAFVSVSLIGASPQQ